MRSQVERPLNAINAAPDAVWEVLCDSRLLPEWVPAVDEVTECSFEGEATVRVAEAHAHARFRRATERRSS